MDKELYFLTIQKEHNRDVLNSPEVTEGLGIWPMLRS